MSIQPLSSAPEKKVPIVPLSKYISQATNLLSDQKVDISRLIDMPELKFPDPPHIEDIARLSIVFILLQGRNRKLKEEVNAVKFKYRTLLSGEKDEEFEPVSLSGRFKEEDLIRTFPCNYEGCKKHYSSEAALIQHAKNKHGEIREKRDKIGSNGHSNANAIFEEPEEESDQANQNSV